MNRAERRRQAKRKKKQKPAAGEATLADAPPSVQVLSILKPAVEAHQAGRLDEAERLYRQILDIDPGQTNANHFLGVIAHHTGRGAEATQLITKAIEREPANSSFHFDLGNVLKALGRLDDAADSHREAIRLSPEIAEPHTNLGLVLDLQGRAEEAAACHREAIRLKPDFAQGHDNLGCSLQELGQLTEAVASYREAIRLEPEFANAHYNLGTALHEMGLAADATNCFEAACNRDPGHIRALSNLLLTQQYIPSVPPSRFIDSARLWAQAFTQGDAKSVPGNTPDPDRRLKVGYVSADFRNHPVGFYITNILAAHDAGNVETFCYSACQNADRLTEQLRRDAAHWRDITGLDDANAVALIRDDAIDVLVDLAGHTTGNRLGVFAHRPAPVQAGWIGYCATTGLAAMDYVLADATVVPDGEEGLFTEQVWRLPGQYLCFAPPDTDIPIIGPAGDAGALVTFGSFNNMAKVCDETVALWAQILNDLPDARLVFKAKQIGAQPEALPSLLQRFAAHGVKADRLTPEGPSEREAFLADYNRIDIALDPFPFSGGATTAEALWMGVPVVTMKNDRWAGRVSETMLGAVGLDQWVADDADAYRDMALQLAASGPRPAEQRVQLRQQVEDSALCDGPGFTRSLETAYRDMWRAWCETA